MATRAYCEHVGAELEVWSGKLHALSEKIERMPSIDKYKLLSQIEELHIIITELDDRRSAMLTACPTVDENPVTEERGPGVKDETQSRQRKNVRFDYDFGG